MAFKPKKKLPTTDDKEMTKTTIAELRKKIAEAEKEVDEVELDEDLDEETEEESEEEQDEESDDQEEIPEIEEAEEPKSKKNTPSIKEEAPRVNLTAEEIVSAIEFNIARAGQLLQLLK